MRRIIIGFICGLLITTNVFAAPATTYGPITSSDTVWDIAAENNVSAINTAVQPEVLSQVDASQQVQMSATLQAQDAAAIKDLADRLAAAEEKSNITQNQVAQIGGRVDLIEKDVRELSEFEKKVSVCFSSKFFMWLQQYADRLSDFLGPQLFMGVIATIIIVLFILLVYLIIPRRKSTSVSYPQDESNKEGDFNHHMDTEDSTASKLNLAHAYMEMGEQNKAKILLHEVLSYGGDAEQEEAKALLDKMKADQ